MAATSFDPRNPYIQTKEGIARIQYLGTEAASSSFKAGALVSVDASGSVAISATGASTAIYGIAMADAAGSASTSVYAQKIEQDDDVIMLITDASGSAAAWTNCAVGVDYDILNTSGVFSINHADATNPAFVFIEGVNDAAGAAATYGKFRILPAVNADNVIAS